ncbi:MAG: hypothetical protein ACLQBB_12930 [Solirubrobacteraceae bacterium]
MYTIAGWRLLHGDLADGERLAEQAFQIGQEAAPSDAAQIYGGQLLFIRRHQGRVNELIEMREQAVGASLASWLDALDRPLHCAGSTGTTRPARCSTTRQATASRT